LKKIKILQVIDSLNVGGAEVLAVNIANSFSKSVDYNVSLCVTRKEGPLKKDINTNVDYNFLKKKSPVDLEFLIKLYRLIKKNNIKIIHAHNTSYFSCVLVNFLFFNRKKLIWHNHSGGYISLSGSKLKILKFCSSYFNTIINVNEELNNWSEKTLRCKKNIVLNNFASFLNNDEITNLKGVEGKRIVCLAGLRPIKNHEYLVNAFEIILKKHPDWTLHLIGKYYEDEYYNSIIKLISNKKLEKCIFLYGLRRDIKNILKQSNIGVLTSKKEGLPISLLEYGLAKLPVVLTDTCNTANLIIDEAIAPSNDFTVFSKKIIEVIENSSLRIKISNILYSNISDNFSEEYFISELKNTYIKL
tara:strand:+ start:15408 stop:16484 length:1077 start_codon:yes stop_codon:yes gene_type:complete